MATLFLIRHAVTAQTGRILYGRTPRISLDARGRSQAEELATRFEGVRLTAIYSSPLERCVETIRPLAEDQRLPVRLRKEMIEMDAGNWTGKPLRSLRRRRAWREILSAPASFRFPGGESFVEASERTVGELLRIARRHRRGRVAIATHGDIVRIALCHAAGAPLDRFQRFVIDPVSVSVLQIDGEAVRLLLVNGAGSLDGFSGHEAPWEATGPKQGGAEQLRG